MLRDANAFSGFAVDDVPRAKEFYGTTLGLEVADAALGVEGADVPACTILNVLVEDVERAVDELTERGVRFERYETPKTDAKGIHRTPEVRPVAWFRDPAGNILSIIEE